jgi:tRNA(Ile)-lysidine synthase
VVERVAETISRYNMFGRGHKVGVAVSGGADSVCLLHVLLELAPRWALRFRILHLNHMLRGEESREDADFVRELGRRLGLEVDVEEGDVARMRDRSGGNLEQLGRQARREFFLRRLGAGQVDRVAMGHTRSDQAETVLFRLLRGCGTAGLAGILPVTREGLVRPLLEVDRREVEEYLRGRNIAWREDSSNRDPAFARNRIRHELLPSLMRDWNPSLPVTLSQMAALAQDEEDYWRAEIDRLASLHLIRRASSVLVKTGGLAALSRPVARRLLRLAAGLTKGNLEGIGFKHLEEILALVRGGHGDGQVDIPGLVVQRSFDWIRFAPAPRTGPAPHGAAIALSVPGSVSVPETGLRIELDFIENGSSEESRGLDAERLPGPLTLRTWRAGDTYRPVGHTRPKSLKRLFQQHKIPSWERGNWPVVASGDVILWSRHFGFAAEYAAGPATRRVLKLRETEDQLQ